jgi:putative transposase
VSARTIRRYRRAVRRRPPSQTWHTFLRNHAPQIWAADFFTVQTATFRTLYVFFFISHDRRRLVHLNVTAHPLLSGCGAS